MFTKYANAEIIAVDMPSKGKTAGRKLSGFDYEPRTDHKYMYVAVRACTADVPNLNYDMLPKSELWDKDAYKTFEGSYVYLNHDNTDPRKARGAIIAAKYHDEGDDDGNEWVEILEELDEEKCPKLCALIRSGEIDTVSMGCNIESSTCSVCGNVAEYPHEYCDHIKAKGQEYGGKLAYEICNGIEFFECSWVYNPADPTAYVQAMEKDAKIYNYHIEYENGSEDSLQSPNRKEMIVTLKNWNGNAIPGYGKMFLNDISDRNREPLSDDEYIKILNETGIPISETSWMFNRFGGSGQIGKSSSVKSATPKKWLHRKDGDDVGIIKYDGSDRFIINFNGGYNEDVMKSLIYRLSEKPVLDRWNQGYRDIEDLISISDWMSLGPEDTGMIDHVKMADTTPTAYALLSNDVAVCVLGDEHRLEIEVDAPSGYKVFRHFEVPFFDVPSLISEYIFGDVLEWTGEPVPSEDYHKVKGIESEFLGKSVRTGSISPMDYARRFVDEHRMDFINDYPELEVLYRIWAEKQPEDDEDIFSEAYELIEECYDMPSKSLFKGVLDKVAKDDDDEDEDEDEEEEEKEDSFANMPRKPDDVPSKEDIGVCPLCNSDSFDGHYCNVCEYQVPPDGFDDIKLETDSDFEEYESEDSKSSDKSASLLFW